MTGFGEHRVEHGFQRVVEHDRRVESLGHARPQASVDGRILDTVPQVDGRLRFVGVLLERGFEHHEGAGEVQQRQ